MAGIRLVPVGDMPRGRTAELTERLGSLLARPIEFVDRPVDPASVFDVQRRQYRSDLMLDLLLPHAPSDGKVLGVTDVDLFIPVLTFVFGEAYLDGRAALVSAYRLRSEMYGLPADPRLLMERLVKEAMHELGHTFGLVHCYNPECVMQPSTYAELIDLKSAAFCAHCAGAMTS